MSLEYSPVSNISMLLSNNSVLYEELKKRETEYIDLIRDLHEENYRLRAMLFEQQRQFDSPKFARTTGKQFVQNDNSETHSPIKNLSSFSVPTNEREQMSSPNAERKGKIPKTVKFKGNQKQNNEITSTKTPSLFHNLFGNYNRKADSYLKKQADGSEAKSTNSQKFWAVKTNKSLTRWEDPNHHREDDEDEYSYVQESERHFNSEDVVQIKQHCKDNTNRNQNHNCKTEQKLQQKKATHQHSKSELNNLLRRMSADSEGKDELSSFQSLRSFKSKQIISNKVYL